MFTSFRILPAAALLVASALSSCSKEQDIAPAASATTTTSNVTDPNYIGGPSVIGYGQQATYSYVHRGNGGTWDLGLDAGFSVVSITDYRGKSYIVVQAPGYDSQTTLDFWTPDEYYGGGRGISAGPTTLY